MTSESVHDASGGLGRALLELAPRLARLENHVLTALEPPLSTRQYRTLQRVAQGHSTLTMLGRVATISLPSVSEQVEGLVRRGLLGRESDPDDRRVVRLTVTTTGRTALDQADEALAILESQLVEGIAVPQQQELAHLVGEIDARVQNRLRKVG